jgi:hypothetical protein
MGDAMPWRIDAMPSARSEGALRLKIATLDGLMRSSAARPGPAGIDKIVSNFVSEIVWHHRSLRDACLYSRAI